MCIIDYKNNFIYIAIPKTASQSTDTFIVRSLYDAECLCNGCSHDYQSGKPEPDLLHDVGKNPHIGGIKKILIKTPFGISSNRLYKHSTALEIKRSINNYDNFKKIAVVRNPFDWYVSWYCYRKKEEFNNEDAKFSFPEWMEKFANRGRDWEMQEILNWVLDEKNNIIVDEIVQYDEIENGIINFFNKNKIKLKNQISFPKINISDQRNNLSYHKFYNKNTKKIVEYYQRKTINFFKYNFFKIL